MTFSEFLKAPEERANSSVAKAFARFMQSLTSKHETARLEFKTTETGLTIRALSIPLVSFAVEGDIEFNRVGSSVQKEDFLRRVHDCRYPREVVDSFDYAMTAIDSRLRVGTPRIDQLPLRCLNSELLVRIATAISDLLHVIGTRKPAAVLQVLQEDKFSNEKGFVYIMNNAAMNPKYLKIGGSGRTSEDRARELSVPTGIPCPFQVAFEIEVDDWRKVERAIHDRLSEFRIKSNREFFSILLKDAIQVVLEIACISNSRDEGIH